MNQQRSRRFRSAQEAQEKLADKEKLLQLLKQQNGGVLPDGVGTEEKKAFDSNSITPGTPFMDILAASLRYWCAYKLNTDPAWKNMKVIISDATVPGEGEHKIMNFVRSQRASPDHDPNTRHVIYGLDADLIMLGLATHEPHFRVLREDVFAQDSRVKTCQICNQKGHDAIACRGTAKEKEGEFDEKQAAAPLKPFIWLHVSVLREYLAVELSVRDLPFRWDIERVIDDWICLCCFVGNDFLPHLPALEIREAGIDTLTAIWRDNLPYMGGYITKDGELDLKRAQLILNGLAKQEDAIFRRRKQMEDKREAGFKRRKLMDDARNDRIRERNSNNGIPKEVPPVLTHDMVINRGGGGGGVDATNAANKSAASALKDKLKGMQVTAAGKAADDAPISALGKRKADQLEADATPADSAPDTPSEKPAGKAEEEPVDEVRLWEDGYMDRYYVNKFHVEHTDIEFRHKVARSYIEGLAWVLLYYFQGCPSWDWYYPYHYAPFAADFVDIDKMKITFTKGRISRPFEQLMSVMPAASRHTLPNIFHDLMTSPDSPVIDFYPEDFDVDLNGKKFAWQGVVLLPFIDMPRLLKAVEARYPQLSEDDARRNGVGDDVLLLCDRNFSMYEHITSNFYSKKGNESRLKLDPKLCAGLAGLIRKIENYVPHEDLPYPLERKEMPDLDFDNSLR
jgi:5'-3' exoribonuclease 2